MADSERSHAPVIDEMFAARGISLTSQRRAVWECFAAAERASTVSEAAEAPADGGIGRRRCTAPSALLSGLGLLLLLHVAEDAPGYTASPIRRCYPLVCGSCYRVVGLRRRVVA